MRMDACKYRLTGGVRDGKGVAASGEEILPVSY